MTRTQVQLPDELYRQAVRLAREREWSLAEVIRRGLENIIAVRPPVTASKAEWRLPKPMNLGLKKDIPVSQWRLLANEPEHFAPDK